MFKAREIAEPDTGHTFIHNMDPRAKIILLFAMAVLVVSVDNEKILFFLLLVPLLAYPIAGLSRNKYWIAFIFLAIGLWGTIFSQALFYKEWPRSIVLILIPREFPVLGKITGGLYVYKEGFFYGLIQGLRFSAMTASGLLLCWTTEPQKMLLGLVRLRIPYRIAFMVVTAIRFLPILLAEIFTVIEAQKLKGFNPLTIKGLFRGVMNTLTPVLANSVRRAGVLAASVESRAFRAYPIRTYLKDLRYNAFDAGITAIFLIGSLSIATIKILYGLYAREILYISALRWVYEIGRNL
ncbi:MAG: energy-coupling factor transporter transmembrane protein EcfT [Deltaproteobacteria bacterium]|nr:energy-coupling factor transporter transmembrane protein EcfT [Deltaproteobacteria bacterium]MBW2020100.1 energy-coupling factor transporter transmembrane protein EcfT [Deltaproteobacteria bacterium]MBW2074737.1 energy-coupling factor transporter transmembrane protein EcfT [Deltaproteobacteria bacterium]RLB80829.1 MAG: energy-coupling factor transporter transmembrane protein EcfT [Deltaproteobacteria bacterium]